MGKLSGKTALITGGTSGIGLAAAKLFKQEGAKVIITASSADTLAFAKKELGDQFDIIQADVSKISEIDQLYAKIKATHGALDIVFANAGVALFQPTIDADEVFYANTMDINTRGVYFTVARALPLLRDGSSVILTCSSLTAKGAPGASVYSASKAAVRSFARSWTAEIPTNKVRFNVLSPGPTATPIVEKAFSKEQAAAYEAQMVATVPAHRIAQPEEMASAALFLASADSSYVMGIELFVDGGFGQI